MDRHPWFLPYGLSLESALPYGRGSFQLLNNLMPSRCPIRTAASGVDNGICMIVVCGVLFSVGNNV